MSEEQIVNQPVNVTKKDRYPDFFIVGAPKCGTTALSAYLGQSPNIKFHRKEIHYFGSDLEFNRPRVTKKAYLDQGSEVKGTELLGDASVYYLYSKEAAREIFEVNPEAKIIICLRNPIDFVQSLHAQLVSNADENILDLEQALRVEKERAQGKSIPWYTHPVHALRYTQMAMFNEQVKRYLETFPHENIKVVFLEELASDVEKVTKETFEFLDADEPKNLNLSVVNPTTTVRFKPLKIMHKTLFPADGKVRKVLPNIVLKPIDFTFFRLMSKKAEKESMPPELRVRLKKMFESDVEALSKTLGKNLSCWVDFA